MIAVTGASGKLGHHVLDGLVKRIPAKEIVALVRDPAKVQDLPAMGMAVRAADYDKPEGYASALEGVDKLLLISGNIPGLRVGQHQAVIDAAKRAGVRHVIYTSLLRADTSHMALARDHVATELAIQASGIAFTFLRNGWYYENQTEHLGTALKHGAITGAAGNGRFSSAARKDYADAAVVVLSGSGHEGQVYELAGDGAYTLADLAAEVSRQSGAAIKYVDMTEAEFRALLIKVGIPDAFASLLADSDAWAARGELDDSGRLLSRMIGHPTATLSEAVQQGLAIA